MHQFTLCQWFEFLLNLCNFRHRSSIKTWQFQLKQTWSSILIDFPNFWGMFFQHIRILFIYVKKRRYESIFVPANVMEKFLENMSFHLCIFQTLTQKTTLRQFRLKDFYIFPTPFLPMDPWKSLNMVWFQRIVNKHPVEVEYQS